MPNYFHYTSGKGLFGILSTSTLQCTHIDFLNDPTENKFLETVLEELFTAYPKYRELYKVLYTSSLEDALYTYNYYVASFSKKQDSLYMWNYYGSGNGYNIEMNIDSIIEQNKKFFDAIFKQDVIYDIELQKTMLIELFNEYLVKYNNYLNNFNGNDIIPDEIIQEEFHDIEFGFSEKLLSSKFLFKHMAYRHEEETRLIIALDYTISQENQSYKVSDSGVIIQYTSLKLDLRKCIKSITVHPAATDLHLTGAHMFLNSFLGYVDKSKIKKSMVPFRII